MKKFLLAIGMVVLSLNLLVGCLNTNTSNQSTKDKNIMVSENIKKNIINNNDDIFLMTQKYYGMQKSWANAKGYFIFNDLNVDKGKIRVYKDNKLLYEIDNDITNNGLYFSIFFNPSGDKFICQKLDRNKKQWQLDLFNTEDGSKDSTYFQQKNELYFLEKWDTKGMFFTKSVSWEEMDGQENKLFVLNSNKKFQEVWDYSKTPYRICDIMDNWVLLKDDLKGKLCKINLDTKKIEDITFKFDSVDLHEVYFYNSPCILIGESIENKEYEVFLLKNDKKQILTKGSFVGLVQNGFVYRKYKKNGDGTLGSESDIYVKPLK